MINYKEPNVKFHFEGLEEATVIDLKKKTLENINEEKMDTWLTKIAKHHPDVQVGFGIKITKNKKGLYNGIFTMGYPGAKEVLRYEREDYKNLYDLVNNAFTNFKERMSD